MRMGRGSLWQGMSDEGARDGKKGRVGEGQGGGMEERTTQPGGGGEGK